MCVVELKLAIMQGGDRPHKAQTKAVSRLGPAFLQPGKALGHLLAIGLGNAGAIVGNADTHLPALLARGNGQQRLARGVTTIFDGILNQVGKGLGQQFPAARGDEAFLDVNACLEAVIFGDRFIRAMAA